MIVHEAEQGSAAWAAARLGIPTASQFHRIVTSTGKLSRGATMRRYMGELCAEWALGREFSDFKGNEWVERGKVLEPQARAAYSFDTDMDVASVGLCYNSPNRLVAASPDGLVGLSLPSLPGADGDCHSFALGGVEMKCPMPATHLMWLADGGCPTEHLMQVQGCLWVTGCEWWDFVSYCPELPLFRHRCYPEKLYQDALDKAIPAFVEELLGRRERLKILGVEPVVPDLENGQ